MNSNERIFLAYLDEMDIITILLPLSYHKGLSSTFSITDESQQAIPLQIIKKQQIENHNKFICRLSEEISFGHTYWIIDDYGGRTDLQIGAVIRTPAFDHRFYYDGNDLGVKCSDNQTQFKLWAPTATQVKLKLRNPNSSFSEIVKMKREDKGVWSIVMNIDLELYQYTFLLLINQEWRESVDPYAVAVTANGELGVIVKLEKTRRPKPLLPPLESPVDAIIYETHIRDFTIHPNSGVKCKGLYLGASELNTKGKDSQLTGLSYVKDLGITHIEFLPFNDFAGVNELEPDKEYNWGYNPIHFNVPEGSYSTKPSDPYARITELKQLIDAIHGQGIKVIMDVVYNHVYIRETSCFEKVVPGYYFRHNELGFPSNGTGVGNDIASERKMVRKFIIDSVRFWMEEYHIDGFRFDLMGILDVETMKEVRKTCDRIQKDTLIIGEGWNLNTPLPIDKKAIIRNNSKLPEIGQFNDKFRDMIKGNTFNLYDKGYVLGNEHYYEGAIDVITGSIGFNQEAGGLLMEPSQSVNYVECHDNHTMWDKLISCLPDLDHDFHMKYHRLATGLVVLSQGIPFLHSGQEFFRTKRGDGNSYKSPDHINRLDWDRMHLYKENVNYLKGLIQIRKELSCFRMKSADQIRANITILPLTAPLIGFTIKNQSHEISEVLLLINPLRSKQLIDIPDGSWTVIVNDKKAGIYSKQRVQGKKLVLEPVCLTILAKK
ncbi:type I pullulanase [Neobacillus sp. DY30]|uniref:type I pullulanase n=1 Tax=Neobacillus sp. DY30 TaxID=3047871 RepID=UPI0024C0DF20|nr:type I pullulanase [Neobacillus sp. DY30]WHX99652.1 type I pullulanase [Neobacillus sp. DY30]